jgi:hypothetical protein
MINLSWGVFPKDRAMAPNGHLYFPFRLFAVDFAAPGMTLHQRAVFAMKVPTYINGTC